MALKQMSMPRITHNVVLGNSCVGKYKGLTTRYCNNKSFDFNDSYLICLSCVGSQCIELGENLGDSHILKNVTFSRLQH